MRRPALLSALLLLLPTAAAIAQQNKVVPVPNPFADRFKPIPEPTSPPARHVVDPRAHLSFNLPSGWNLSRQDGAVSTFALDARSALARTHMHVVASIDFNPYPYSTFSGLLFYVSATPDSTPLACSNQAVAPLGHPVTNPTLDGVPFKHGYTEHGGSCIESRDDVYTALRGSSCLRFDLVLNSFCGGESSGARDLTETELAALHHRLETILESVRFDPGSQGSANATSHDLQQRSSSTPAVTPARH